MIKLLSNKKSKSLNEDFFSNKLNEDHYILNEAYFGKSKELLECERIIDKAKECIINKDINGFVKYQDKLSSILAKFFNVESLYIDFNANMDFGAVFNAINSAASTAVTGNLGGIVNTIQNVSNILPIEAYTWPFFCGVRKVEDMTIIMKKDRIYYKTPKGKYLYVHISLSVFSRLNTEEIMAVILHEIGHNFYLVKTHPAILAILAYLQIITNFIATSIAIQGITNNDEKRAISVQLVIGSIVASIENLIRFTKNPTDNIKKMKNVIDIRDSNNENYFANAFSMADFEKSPSGKTLNFISDLVGKINIIPMILFGGILSGLFLITKILCPIVENLFEQNYNSEKYADNFAATHGYAIGQYTTLKYNKIEKGNLEKYSIFNLFADLVNLLVMYTVFLFDPHSDSLTRARFLEEKLEYDLSKAEEYKMSKTMINDLRNQLKRIKELKEIEPEYKKILTSIITPFAFFKNFILSLFKKDKDIFDLNSFNVVKLEEVDYFISSLRNENINLTKNKFKNKLLDL